MARGVGPWHDWSSILDEYHRYLQAALAKLKCIIEGPYDIEDMYGQPAGSWRNNGYAKFDVTLYNDGRYPMRNVVVYLGSGHPPSVAKVESAPEHGIGSNRMYYDWVFPDGSRRFPVRFRARIPGELVLTADISAEVVPRVQKYKKEWIGEILP